MPDASPNPVLSRIRRALGRTGPLAHAPLAPEIEEPITRLVHTDFGLPELFARTAQQNKMHVDALHIEELTPRLIEFLRNSNCRSLVLPDSPFLDKLSIHASLKDAGFDARRWPEITLDEVYDVDCGITDVYAAVAETGSLVIRPSPRHGRAISLVPPIHVAILQPRDFVPDLLDLMERIAADPAASGNVIITGPSKTADIEMNLVTGVHGPGVVQIFILQ